MGKFDFSKPNVEEMMKKRDVKGLIKALKHEDGWVRYKALKALGKIGDEMAVEPVTQILGDEIPGRRIAAAQVLGEIGSAKAVEPLIQALKDEDNQVRTAATEALSKIGDARAVEPLIQALRDNDEKVRYEAAKALGEMHDVRAVEPLIETLHFGDDWHGTWSIRSDAAKALGEIGDVRAVEPLIQAMKRNGHIRVRSSAAHALDELGFQPKNDEEKAYYLIASNSWGDLVNVGEPAVKPLIETLESIHEDPTQWDAAKALGEIGDSRAVQPLTQILIKESRKGEMGGEMLQKRAVEALGKIGDARAVEPLTQALKNVYPDVRHEAAKALEKIQSKKS